MIRSLLTGLAMLLLACGTGAHAHKPSDAYLNLERHGSALRAQWDIALRDLDTAIGLDADGDGEITWGELRAKQSDVAAYALSRLDIRSGDAPCPLHATAQLADRHSDGAYAVVMLDGACAVESAGLTVRYTLLFDVDPQHRGLVHLIDGTQDHTAIFTADMAEQSIGARAGAWSEIATYAREGMSHIWLGFDHILFLLSLLLPAVLVRQGEAWQAVRAFREAFVDLAKVVTAFTIAHSITLTLAALGSIALPSRWVESAIALSVVLAAINNVHPVVRRGRWIAAFAFGLVHGFAFAGALQDLGVPRGTLAVSLFAFNLGVEAGQLCIVGVFLPIAFALRHTKAYRRGGLVAVSCAIAAIGTVWLVERAFDMRVLSAFAS